MKTILKLQPNTWEQFQHWHFAELIVSKTLILTIVYLN